MSTPIRLELSDGSSHKFWEGAASGTSLTVRFGRIGTDGQTQTKSFPDAKAAQAALDKLVAEKIRKGYAAKSKAGAAKGATPAAGKGARPAAAKGDGALAGVLSDLEAVTDPKKRRPATAANLAAIEKVIGSVPADLRALYGFAGNPGAVFGDADGMLDWLDLTSAVTACKENRKYETPESLFPIATDNAGNYACFDRDTGRIADWDHETREATALAPSLAGYLAKTVVPILRRDQKEKAALSKEKGQTVAPEGAMPAAPKKLVAVPNAMLRKFDRESYGGGGRSLQFVGDDTVVMGMQNGSPILHLSKQKETDVWSGGDAVVLDPKTNRILLVTWGCMALADAKTGKLLARFQAPGVSHAASACLSPDGAIAAVASNQGELQLWDLGGGKGIPMGVEDGRTPSYDLPKGKPMAALAKQGNFVRMRFSPDGATLAVGDSEGKLCLWDVAARKLDKAVPYREAIGGVDWALDGASIFVGLEGGKVDVLDRSGKSLRHWRSPDDVADLRVLPNGVVATIGRKLLSLADATTGRVLAKLATTTGAQPPAIADVRGDLILTRGPAALVRVV